MSTEKRKVLTLEILPLLLTAVIAISACLSTYFSYQTAKISSGQESREQRKEFIEWVTLLKEISDSVRKLESQEKSNQQSSSKESKE